MLFALGQPVAFAGLLVAFLLGLVLRAVAIRATARSLGPASGHDSVSAPRAGVAAGMKAGRREPILRRLRHDIDPFGAVAAAVGGTGWGKGIDLDEVPRYASRGRRAAVLAAGPIAALVLAQVVLGGYAAAYPRARISLAINRPSDVLFGVAAFGAATQFVVSVGVGLLCFGLLALIPLPPLDGFGLLWLALRRPGPGAQRAWLWLVEKNLGVVILLAMMFFPFGHPLLHLLFDLVGTPLMRIWS